MNDPYINIYSREAILDAVDTAWDRQHNIIIYKAGTTFTYGYVYVGKTNTIDNSFINKADYFLKAKDFDSLGEFKNYVKAYILGSEEPV